MKKQKKPDVANVPNLLFFSKDVTALMRQDILKLLTLACKGKISVNASIREIDNATTDLITIYRYARELLSVAELTLVMKEDNPELFKKNKDTDVNLN
jgi:hypothetical protein